MNTRLIMKCLFAVILLHSIQTQAQHFCEMPPDLNYYADSENKKGKGNSERATCFGNNLTSNADRYKLQQNFIPVNGQGIKTLRINFHSIQNSTQFGNKGNFENTTADLTFLNLMVSKVNDLFANVSAPVYPQTCICGSNCSIPDTRIRIELAEVHFDYSPSLYGTVSTSTLLNDIGQNTEKELNIFFNGDNSGPSPGGFSIPLSYNDLSYDQAIVVTNYNKTYESGLNGSGWQASILANNLFHELGHTLGLLHTYESTCCPETMSPSNFDYLNDFFGGTIPCPQLQMPLDDWCNVGPNNDCSNNWMGAHTTSDSREATPKQMGRVHRATMLSSARKYFKPNSSYISEHLVSSDEIWDFNIRMYGNVRVVNGATLTIRCKVNMPPGSKIIVEENGHLVVDGGVITDIENKTWRGIDLEGDATKSQYSENGIFYHGRLTTKNDAIIENARLAVYSGYGGIIESNNTQFLNNEIDAEISFYINKYPSYAGILAGLPAPNISKFTDCDFYTTKTLNTQNGHPDKHIHFKLVEGVKVRKCSFKNTITSTSIDIADRGIGIFCNEASFSVQGTCNGLPPLGSPCTNYHLNEFDGLAYGVYANSSNPMYTADIDHCLFNNNWRGVYINGMDHSTVKNSIFHISTPPGSTWNYQPSDYNYGIYVISALGFAIENNEFDTQGVAHFGIYTTDTNDDNGSTESIYRNKFTGINTAVTALGKNDGLLYRCNEFYNSQSISISIATYTSTIANPQGTCTDDTTPASNYFDNFLCTQNSSEIKNNSSQYSFVYNAHSSPTNYVPGCVSNTSLNICNNTTYTASACPDPESFYFAIDKIAKVSKDVKDFKSTRGSLISNAGTIDKGDKAYLINEIKTQSSISSLYNTLANASPYLSDDVLVEMLVTPNALGEAEKKEILISNSSLTEYVLNTLNTLEPRFSVANLNEIYESQGPISARSILEDQILSMTRDLELKASSIIRQYMALDIDIENGFIWQDAAIDILNLVSTSDMEGLYSNVQVKLAQMHMSKGDLATADQILSSFESTVDNNYQSNIMRMAIAQQEMDATIFDVSDSELTLLDDWSQDKDKKGYANAASILASINGEIFLEEFALTDSDDEESLGLTKDSKTSLTFNLYPNPSNGNLTITYEGSVDDDETLKVYSLTGRLLGKYPLEQHSTQINLNHLVNGIYMIRYKNQLKRMIIQH